MWKVLTKYIFWTVISLNKLIVISGTGERIFHCTSSKILESNWTQPPSFPGPRWFSHDTCVLPQWPPKTQLRTNMTSQMELRFAGIFRGAQFGNHWYNTYIQRTEYWGLFLSARCTLLARKAGFLLETARKGRKAVLCSELGLYDRAIKWPVGCHFYFLELVKWRDGRLVQCSGTWWLGDNSLSLSTLPFMHSA
jgi:hypothetical protein